MARLLISLCVALVVLQGANSALPTGKEIVQSIHDRFTNLASSTVNKAQEVVVEVWDNIHKTFMEHIIKIENAIFDFKKKIHEEAQAIVDKVEAEGKDVKNCTEQFGSGIEALKKKGEDAIACVSDPILLIKNLTEELTHSALAINDTVADGQAKLEACKKTGGVFEQTACQIQIGGSLLSTIVEATTKIFSLIAHLTNSVTTLPTQLQSCEMQVWTNATVLAATNLSDLKTCLKNAV